MTLEEEIKEFIKDIHPRGRARRLSTEREDLLEYLKSKYPSYQNDISTLINFVERGLNKEPLCVICGAPVNVPKRVTAKTCSRKCRDILKKKDGSFERATTKSKKTNIKKYGVENPCQNKAVQKKRLDTMIERYGALVSPKSREKTRSRASDMNRKGRESLKRKYGVDNPGQMENHREKCVATTIKNFGVDHYTKAEEFREKAKLKNSEKWRLFSPSSIEFLNVSDNLKKKDLFTNPNMLVKFNCKDCDYGEQEVPTETYKWRIRNAGTPCIKCSNLNKGSLKESRISDFVESLGVKVKRNDRIFLNGKEVDILIQDHKLAIEFNGLFWHNENRAGKESHRKKVEAIRSQGYRAILIFEDEWDYNEEIVKSRIKNALGLITTKVYARNCDVKEVSSCISREFLLNNHTQGFANSSVKLGLYHNNELVSLMTFSKPNLSRGLRKEDGVWEISRFCSKINVNVIGAASKLFNHFIKQHDPQKVITYADLRWGEGKFYENLGFEFEHNTKPNYWYIQGERRIHRFALRKNKDDDSNLTEYENRLKQGYVRIWDCGSSKWLWKKN